jgi:hypothetical protein
MRSRDCARGLLQLLRGIFSATRRFAVRSDEALQMVKQLSVPDGQFLLPNYPAMPITRVVCSQLELADSADLLAEFIDTVSVPHTIDGQSRGTLVDVDAVLSKAMAAYDNSMQVRARPSPLRAPDIWPACQPERCGFRICPPDLIRACARASSHVG